MPYPTSEAELQRLTGLAIDNPEIRQGMDDANLDLEDLHAEVKRMAEGIWPVARKDIAGFEELENQLVERQKDFDAKYPPLSSSFSSDLSKWASRLANAIWLGLVLSVAGLIFYGNKFTYSALLKSPAVFVLLTVGVSEVLLIWLFIRLSSRIDEQREAWDEEVVKRDKQREALWKERGLQQLADEMEAKKKTIEKLLIDHISGGLREYLYSRVNASYDTRLTIERAPGLAEIFDKSYAIDTASKKSLQFMLENMPGGSIGIAGPRGAGKTTLLRLFCGRKKLLDELKGKPVLALMVSAPVEYQARDFILYLFASVCRSFLDYNKEPYDQPRVMPELFADSPPSSKSLRVQLRPLAYLCYYLGIALVVLGLTAAVVVTIASAQLPAQPAAATRASDAGEKPESSKAGDAAEQQSESSKAGDSAEHKTDATAPQPLFARVVLAFVKALQLNPGAMVTWGLFSLAAALLLGVITEAGMLRFVPLPEVARHYLRKRLFQRLAEQEQEEEELRQRQSLPDEKKDLIDVARDRLANIKFQQSFTSGWSGALKLPIGLEGGVNRAINLAQNQQSLPEIVHALTRFLERLSDQFQLIIGIDELDKIESDEKAQQFLNEIKSIFGLERCFYLISVSENAMSSFERRGLPFRDVFDSSFDTIIYVDYLDFASAQKLIKQRVLGASVPFFALSYCLSGGLARDVIRIFRGLIELRKAAPQQNDLETLCRALIQADLKAKLRAAALTAKKIKLGARVDRFLEKVYACEGSPLSDASLLKAMDALFPRRSAGGHQANHKPDDKDTLADHEKLDALQEELATYIYYLFTLLQFFKNTLDEAALTRTDESGTLDDLARARQLLAVNPDITRMKLNRFRAVHALNDTPLLFKTAAE